jgi:hypothetical protein
LDILKIIKIIIVRLGTEVGSVYEHCTSECMFVLLARMLPALQKLPKAVSHGLRVYIAAPEPIYVGDLV